jgi:protoporphyrinogen/coproporphyrinogen III oxidase
VSIRRTSGPTEGVDVVVIGGGIAGLTAAHDLARDSRSVLLLEADERVGGKLRTEPFAGVDLETAADSFLARRPEALDLCRELGLDDDLVSPAETSSYVFARGELRRLPAGTVLGVPTDFRALRESGVLSSWGARRAALEPWLPGSPLDADTTVGELIGRRFGSETAARLVDPLVGGINAGHTDRLSIDVVAPQLAAAARKDRSLVRALRSMPASASPAGPVFYAPQEGLTALVMALVASIERNGGDVRERSVVERLDRSVAGYRVTLRNGHVVDAGGVVLALPAWHAAPLLGDLAPTASKVLGDIDYASVAMTTLAFAEDDVPGPLDASGFLVPRPEGRTISGCTWADRKWAHLRRPGQVTLRVSAGRVDNRDADLPDDELLQRIRADLAVTMGITADPTDVRIHRWPRSFPQYAPGHLDRVATATAELTATLPRLALAGAALAGVGIPACIGSGRQAALVAGRPVGARPGPT